MAAAGLGASEFDIFVSYARDDAARVQLLVSALDAEGWRIFWDQDVLPGETWESHIGVHLDTAPVVLAVWSQSSVKSRFVNSEATRGLERSSLVPVLLDAVRPPFGFEHINAFDLRDWLQAGAGPLPGRLKISLERRIGIAGASNSYGQVSSDDRESGAAEAVPATSGPPEPSASSEASDSMAHQPSHEKARPQIPPPMQESKRKRSAGFYLMCLLALGSAGYAVGLQTEHQATKEQLQTARKEYESLSSYHQATKDELEEAKESVKGLEAQLVEWNRKDKAEREEQQRAAAAVAAEEERKRLAQAALQADRARARKHAPFVKTLEDYVLIRNSIAPANVNDSAKWRLRIYYLGIPKEIAGQITSITYKTEDTNDTSSQSPEFGVDFAVSERCRFGSETLVISAALRDGDVVRFASDAFCYKWKMQR